MIAQLFKFVVVGGINTVIGLAIIAGAMYFFGINPIVANAFGYSIGVALSFVLNGKLTFRQNALSQQMLVRFVGVCLIAYVANVAAVWMFLGRDKYLAQVIGMAVYVLVSFMGSRMFVFRE